MFQNPCTQIDLSAGKFPDFKTMVCQITKKDLGINNTRIIPGLSYILSMKSRRISYLLRPHAEDNKASI